MSTELERIAEKARQELDIELDTPLSQWSYDSETSPLRTD